jgi:hypothetical protein
VCHDLGTDFQFRCPRPTAPGDLVSVHSFPHARERTQTLAERFLDEMRLDFRRTRIAGSDVLPRVRCVNERAGHATPEFRTLVIPPPPSGGAMTPAVLSAAIAYFAAKRGPDRLFLALDALQRDEDGSPRPVLIAEARDLAGTRLFLMQPYRPEGRDFVWDEPMNGGWFDPGDEEMILDAAFQP